jgi:hypothetical protein
MPGSHRPALLQRLRCARPPVRRQLAAHQPHRARCPPPAGPFAPAAAQAMLDNLILGLAAVSGMQQENMTRGHGWRFHGDRPSPRARPPCPGDADPRTGARLAATDDSILTPLLEICDSTMTYRQPAFRPPTLHARGGPAAAQRCESPLSRPHQFNVLGRLTTRNCLPIRSPTCPLRSGARTGRRLAVGPCIAESRRAFQTARGRCHRDSQGSL